MEYHGNGIYMHAPPDTLRNSIQDSFQIGISKDGVPILLYTVLNRRYAIPGNESPDGLNATLTWAVPFNVLREHTRIVHEFQPEIIGLMNDVSDRFDTGGYQEQIDHLLSGKNNNNKED